ncbi:hypothetical protein HYG87_03710 [Methanobacterium alkalithermotolerans]|uniref:Uncharacterized protein n=1 Tax=Methanobacterium alkalithermotolerans TaxID=2731220 RepID=A0A8T8K4V0_9EURY|nr:hypothetical protein [Methanobacterium alkalithermotolerans]QUH22939.1 hypothetical protein HYG87_03710 [Methanobacterium alkalithermotolerans]
MLIISPLFSPKSYLNQKIRTIKPFEKWEKNDFLKMAIIIVLFIYIMGIILEIYLRINAGVSLFTTFVSLNPSPSTSSILHSHMFKGAISPFLNSFISTNSSIHTGGSLSSYIPDAGWIILLAIPVVYLGGMLSLGDRREYHKLIVLFALTTSIIGMIDGGLLSTPALVGLSGLLGMSALKMPFSFKNLISPTIIIAFLIILRVILGLFASFPDYYEVTIIDAPEDLKLLDYNILSSQVVNNKTIITLDSNYNEIHLINDLASSLEGKSEVFFISWNFYSFFGNTAYS